MLRSIGDRALNLAVSGLAFQRFALVDLGFAFTNAELNFGVPLSEVNLQRNNRHAHGVDLIAETDDFFFVEQQAAGTERVNIVAIAEFVGIDVGVV